MGVAALLLVAMLGSVLLLIANAARGLQFLALAARDPVGAVRRVVTPGDQRREIEALQAQLVQLESKIDATNRPWIKVPDIVSDAFDGLAGFAGGLMNAGYFAELRKRMDEVLAKFPNSNLAKRIWIDATQGLADEASRHGKHLLAAARYREAIARAEEMLTKS